MDRHTVGTQHIGEGGESAGNADSGINFGGEICDAGGSARFGSWRVVWLASQGDDIRTKVSSNEKC